MRNFRLGPGLKAWFFVFSAAAFLASGTARAASQYVVVQPIDVCASGGTGCAPFCSTTVNSPSASPSSICVTNPSTAITSTPIGFVDPATHINNTRAIWLQAGIDVLFLPIVRYNNSNFQNITVTCSTGDNPCSGVLASSQFKQLSSLTGTPPPTAAGCTSSCTDPVGANAPFPNANAINMFFVNSLVPGAADVPSPLFGFAWINGDGIAVAKSTFVVPLGATPHFDTLAHEIGHNLGLDHNSGLGAGNNVMTAGSSRTVPVSSGCSPSTTNGGALFDLDVLTIFDCPGLTTALADQLISSQDGTVFPSGFLNPIPFVSATAGGGGGDLPFTVEFGNGSGRTNEYIVALILELPEGFQFGPNLFTQTGTSSATLFEPPRQLNGNNGGGNSNCLKPVSGPPTVECLEILFNPGTFTAGTTFRFTADIIDKKTGQPATPFQLGCAIPADPTQCLDLSFLFSDLLATTSEFDQSGFANSQSPGATAPALFFDPTDFPNVANLNPPLTITGFTQTPCTLFEDSCPPLGGGDPHGGD